MHHLISKYKYKVDFQFLKIDNSKQTIISPIFMFLVLNPG